VADEIGQVKRIKRCGTSKHRWNEILGKMMDGEQKDFLRFVLRMFKAIHKVSFTKSD
jgi:hypothetical protein